MNLTTFCAIKNDNNNQEWLENFNKHWPAYKSWYQSKKTNEINPNNLQIAEQKLKNMMPEIFTIYQQLKHITNDNSIISQFLTLYQPPAYLINCSQAVFFDPEPMLIRNYDLSPDLSENTIFHTDWLARKVISTNECLWGADDGINDVGLAISLTFGGRKVIGDGFGIPIILRYVLQTCENVKQAVTQLKRIPSHMSYNVTVLDKSGDYSTVLVAPDREAIITKDRVATNHQQNIEWQEQAVFSKTLERKEYLEKLISEPFSVIPAQERHPHLQSAILDSRLRGNDEGKNKADIVKPNDEKTIIDAFHRPPLYSTNYQQSFGTVYTAVYKPQSACMTYHWPNQQWQHSFKQFNQGQKKVQLGQSLDSATEWQASDSYSNDLLSRQIKAQFDSIFDYLPESAINNKSAFNQLKQKLKSNQAFNWQHLIPQYKRSGHSICINLGLPNTHNAIFHA